MAQNSHLSILSNSTACELPSPELTASIFTERRPLFCKPSWVLWQIRNSWPILGLSTD
jgi:hypothetical protein